MQQNIILICQLIDMSYEGQFILRWKFNFVRELKVFVLYRKLGTVRLFAVSSCYNWSLPAGS